NIRIIIAWTPGHIDIEGNEEADKEAKKAAQEGSSERMELPAPLRKTMPYSRSALRQDHMKRLKKDAKKIWTTSPRCARMEQFDKTLP
ncbi:hypothetical protein GALMADRAFT_48719, partial [Galerina marginata CBS 339.88]